MFKVGDKVKKESGDYKYYGEVIEVFKKKSGEIRYCVENRDGMLFIFNDKTLQSWETEESFIQLLRRLIDARMLASKPDGFKPRVNRMYEYPTNPEILKLAEEKNISDG